MVEAVRMNRESCLAVPPSPQTAPSINAVSDDEELDCKYDACVNVAHTQGKLSRQAAPL